MTTIRTRGIVIRKVNFGEADRILTIMTTDRGKLRVVAKGVRRTKAKLAGWLDMFADNQLELAEGRNLDIVTSAISIRNFAADSLTLPQTGLLYYVCELVDKLLEETHEVGGVFALLHETITAIVDATVSAGIAKTYFEIKLLTILGFAPELYQCVVMGQKLNGDSELHFSHQLGGMVCADAPESDVLPIISREGVKLLRVLQRSPLATVRRVRVADETTQEVSHLMSEFVEYTTDRRIKSLEVLGQLS